MSSRRFAILIASSSFPNEPGLPTLQFPENDADGLNEVLRSEERGNFNNTVVLKNEPRDKVIRELHKTLKEARKDDLVVIYYSGHGKRNELGHLHLATTDTEIALLESTSIPMDTIKRLTDTTPSNKKIIILDCCFSGAAGDMFTKGGIDDQLQILSKGYGTYIMTASTSIETAKERTEDRYGVFTKHIIGGIRSGEADRNNDGVITIDELYDYVHEQVCAEGCGQEPMKWGLNVKGEMVIAKSGKTPKEDRRRQIFAKLLELGHHLPARVLSDAIRINDSDMSDENSGYVGLLEKLADNRLNAGEFVLEWREFSVEAPKKPDPPQPKVVPTVKQSKPQQDKPSSVEREFTNSLGMKFVYIPPGEFMMGSSEDEPGRYDDEVVHKVTLTQGFYIQTTPVTQKQWMAVMGHNPSYFEDAGEDCPVESVSWDDVQEFIKKLHEKEETGRYRLPTEAEWEYAARAGTRTAIYSGNMKIIGERNAPALDPIAWYGGNSGVDYEGGYDSSGWKEKQYDHKRAGTHPVGKKKPNASGLYDMLGNVWEWCQDRYGDYPAGAVTDPPGPDNGSGRVLRGGGWNDFARNCRSANRDDFTPGYRNVNSGFRLVHSQKVSSPA